jgi:hypothetical protein
VKRKPDIIEAIKNPKLFGSLPRFKKLDTWSAWLVVFWIFQYWLDLRRKCDRHSSSEKTRFGAAQTLYDIECFFRLSLKTRTKYISTITTKTT